MSKHTNEPWEGDRNIVGADGTVVATVNRPAGGNVEVEDANAERITTCVNALAGIKDPAGFIERVKSVLDYFQEEAERRDNSLGRAGDAFDFAGDLFNEAGCVLAEARGEYDPSEEATA